MGKRHLLREGLLGGASGEDNVSTITILTDTPGTWAGWLRQPVSGMRQLIRAFDSIGKSRATEPRIDGPTTVQVNLLKGFEQIGQAYFFNPPVGKVTRLVGVLSNPAALRWAIGAKERGRIRWLIAGPNLVVTPDQQDGILNHPAIDLVVTPSKWVSQCYAAIAPGLSDKLVEWSAGVDENYWCPRSDQSASQKLDFLIFAKLRSPSNEYMINEIGSELANRGFSFSQLRYGTFQHGEYRSLLRASKALLYVTESESQGLALFEAWACDVPTLVWDRKYWEWHGHRFEASSAPYLSAQCGLSFNDLSAFPEKLESFVATLPTFRPREYIRSSFTQAQAAHSYSQLLVLDEKTSWK